MASQPLEQLRVLDLSRLLPGPFCSLILGDLGAEVVKVEDTGAGDYLRRLPPQRGEVGGAFYALNRGKRSIAIDLKRPAGRDALLRLLPGFDVVIESFRPGVLERLGCSFEVLRRHQPRVVLCSISGYGQHGPYRERAGHDLNYLALAGVLATTGPRGGAPTIPGVQVADLAGGGLWAAVRILAALRQDEAAHLDVSMTDGALSLLVPWLGELAFGAEPLRRGEAPLNGGLASYRCYRTADERYLGVAALEPKFWSALRGALDQPTSPADALPDEAHQAELASELEQRFATATRDDWADELAATNACVEPVLELDELEHHRLHRDRGTFFTIDDPRRGAVTGPRLPLDAPPRATPAPLQGEHSAELLRRAGFAEQEIEALLADGTVLQPS